MPLIVLCGCPVSGMEALSVLWRTRLTTGSPSRVHQAVVPRRSECRSTLSESVAVTFGQALEFDLGGETVL